MGPPACISHHNSNKETPAESSESENNNYTSFSSITLEGKTFDDIQYIEQMRRRLKYHFMDPIEKYIAKKTIPYKLLLQIFKIILVTAQLTLFGAIRSGHIDFIETNVVSFRHLYLKDWSNSMETPPYPASHGPFAVYTYDEFYDTLNYAVERYNATDVIALKRYQLNGNNTRNIWFCQSVNQNTSDLDDEDPLTTSCLPVSPVSVFNQSTQKNEEVFDMKMFFALNNIVVNFDNTLFAWLNFSLRAVHMNAMTLDLTPECFMFNIKILFDNQYQNGQIPVDVKAEINFSPCNEPIHHDRTKKNLLKLLDIGVIVISLVSFISCLRSLIRSWRICWETDALFEMHMTDGLGLGLDKWNFLNGWFILIIINDVLVVTGSLIKVLDLNLGYDKYMACTYFLGLGSMMVWLGVLRYLSFAYKYNILILTLERAMPNVMRFMLCFLIIFVAFSLCGWVILGPYHVKFRSFTSSLECLYSLINGDDMFTTFSFLSAENGLLVFIFSRIYLYIFCSLFIYVVLNLFVTLIIEAYQDIKELSQNHGRPKTRLWSFINECPHEPQSALFRSDDFQRSFHRRIERKERCDTFIANISAPFLFVGKIIRQVFVYLIDCCRRKNNDDETNVSTTTIHEINERISSTEQTPLLQSLA